jgi:hypothetical protein
MLAADVDRSDGSLLQPPEVSLLICCELRRSVQLWQNSRPGAVVCVTLLQRSGFAHKGADQHGNMIQVCLLLVGTAFEGIGSAHRILDLSWWVNAKHAKAMYGSFKVSTCSSL